MEYFDLNMMEVVIIESNETSATIEARMTHATECQAEDPFTGQDVIQRVLSLMKENNFDHITDMKRSKQRMTEGTLAPLYNLFYTFNVQTGYQ